MRWFKNPSKVKRPDTDDAREELQKNPELSASAIQKIFDAYPEEKRLTQLEEQKIRTCRMLFDNYKEDEMHFLDEFADIIKRILKKKDSSHDKGRLQDIYEDLDQVESTAEALTKAIGDVAFVAKKVDGIIDREQRAMKQVLPDEYRIVRFLNEEEEKLLGLVEESHNIMKQVYKEMSSIRMKCDRLSKGERLEEKELEELLIVVRSIKKDLKLGKLDMEKAFKIGRQVENMVLSLNERFKTLKEIYARLHKEDHSGSVYDDYRKTA